MFFSSTRKKILKLNQPLPPSMVGWKFARLKTMFDHRLPVPRLFCLTALFYREIFQPLLREAEAYLQEIDFSDPRSIRDGSEKLQKLFTGLVLSDRQEKEILGEFDREFGPKAMVSVRSSMVGSNLESSEDSADNPFAGISNSYLYVTREQLLDKVRLCWASGFNYESIIYRHQHNLDLLDFSVAVGIQEMIPGERSFVAFTCDPNTAARDTVIVAGHGIGEGVVQEKVAVDHYFQNFMSGKITTKITTKSEMLTLDRDKGHDMCFMPVPAEKQNQPCLNEEEIQQISELGRKIENIFQGPQDIEGTITSDGNIYILQSRPVSIDYRRQRVWTNANVTESFPGVTTALTYSFSRFFYRVIFYDCYRLLGINPRTLQDNHEMLDKMIGFLKGRVYYNLTHFYHLHNQSPMFSIFSGPWEKMMGFLSSYQTGIEEGAGARMFRKIKGFFSFTRAAGNMLYLKITHQKRVHKFHEWWENLIQPLRGKNFTGEDPMVLYSEFHRVWREVGNYWGVTLINDTFLPLYYSMTEGLFSRWGLTTHEPSLMSDLLCGDEDLMSVEIVLSAVSLAEKVRDNPRLREAFEQEKPQVLWSKIEKEELEPEFSRAVKSHLHSYGDRGLQELKLEQPNLRHTPGNFVKMIQDYSRTEVTVEALRSREKATRQEAEKKLKQMLKKHPLRRLVLNRLLNSLREFIRNRENSRYCRSELFGFSKNIFYAFGSYFADQGILRSGDDIFHLGMEEIFGYIDGTGITEDLQSLADIRRKEHHANQEVDTPEQITTLGPVRANALAETATAEEDSALRGLGSSSGRVKGTAKVIFDPNEEVEVTDDMILVARETDPGWLFLMLSSRGIVVEKGSMLSHTAITGRKFNIPTVVSVPGATSRIPNGAQIELDGAAGTVTLLE